MELWTNSIFFSNRKMPDEKVNNCNSSIDLYDLTDKENLMGLSDSSSEWESDAPVGE